MTPDELAILKQRAEYILTTSPASALKGVALNPDEILDLLANYQKPLGVALDATELRGKLAALEEKYNMAQEEIGALKAETLDLHRALGDAEGALDEAQSKLQVIMEVMLGD